MSVALIHGTDSARARLHLRTMTAASMSIYLSPKDIAEPSSDIAAVDLLGEKRSYVLMFAPGERLDRKELGEQISHFARLIAPEDNFILLANSKLAAKHVLVSRVEKLGGKAYLFEPLKGSELKEFIREISVKEGAVLAAVSINYIADTFADLPERIVVETQKASLLARVGREELVSELCPVDRSGDSFAFSDAVGERNLIRAFAQLEDIGRNSDAIFSLLGLLYAKGHALMLAASSSDDALIASSAKIHPYALKIARSQLRGWGVPSVRRLLGELLKLDSEIKSGYKRSGIARLQLLLAKLLDPELATHPRPLRS